MFRWLKYRQHKDHPAILRDPQDTLSSKRSLLYQSNHILDVFFCASSRIVFEEQEQCFIIHRKLLSLIKRMKDRKSDARVCSANLDNASSKSWDEFACNADGGKSEKFGSTNFWRFSLSLFCRAHAYSKYTFSYAQQRVGGLDFCKPVSFSAYPHASCGGGLNATLSFSWSILKEIGVTGI